uniref:Zonadhesin n=1 Tax=Panagrolaimus superbus TaxID=310955 RepID=A0A914YLG9_9BILA
MPLFFQHNHCRHRHHGHIDLLNNRQFAQPTFNQAAFEKALPPTPTVVKNEYTPPTPPIRTDFNPYIPPSPRPREGFGPVQPAVTRPVNPQDQWPANTRKPAGGSYGMEEIPHRENNHIQIQPINPTPEVPNVQQHQWPTTTQQPLTSGPVVAQNKPENLVPIFAASSHLPQPVPTTTPTLTRLPMKQINTVEHVQPTAPIAPPRIIQPINKEVNNQYSNIRETVEITASPVAPTKPERIETIAPVAPSTTPQTNSVPDEYGRERETVESVSPVVEPKAPEHRVNEKINNEYSSGPESFKPIILPQPDGKPINHEYSSGPETIEKPSSSPAAPAVEKSESAPVTSAPTAPERNTEATVKSPQAPNVGGYKEAQQETTKFPTLKPEAPTTSDSPKDNVEAQKPETETETPEESLVVLNKASSEAAPTPPEEEIEKSAEKTKEVEKLQTVPETYEISDITASSTSAPPAVKEKINNNYEVKATSNVNEYRVFGEKSNSQNAIEPSKIPEEKTLGKPKIALENNVIRLQVIDGGSDRSVGRKPIALPEGFVNIPINKEMEKALLEETIIPHHSVFEGKEKTKSEGEEKVIETKSENEVRIEAVTNPSPIPPRAPPTMSTPPSRLVFAEKHERIEILNSSTNSPKPEFEAQTSTDSSITTTTATKKLIRIQPIHPTPTTTKPEFEEVEVETSLPTITTTLKPLSPSVHLEEKILTPIIEGDIEEHHPHGMLEEIVIPHVRQEEVSEIPTNEFVEPIKTEVVTESSSTTTAPERNF